MPTIAAVTLGCKVNQYDTEAMLEAFEAAGYEVVPFERDADVYLVNTCTVTGTGDQKSLKTVRRAARSHPDSAVIVCGCLAQREAEAIARMDGVKLVLGVQRRGEVVSLLEQALAEGRTINAVAPLRAIPFEALSVSRHEGRTRATMKIQEGCDRFCSYCIIPYVRGPVRSMPLENVRAEARLLAEAGYREIVVTGIHLASYGRGTGESLIDAISAVHDTPGVARVRLGSLEPGIVTPSFARALGCMPGLAQQFHLSLQSGSASVLKRMHRRYTPEQYLEACALLRESMPRCAVTTDVIAGFPGETEEEFAETQAFLCSAQLARLHVFPYSRRSGTVADRLPGQLTEAEKHARAQALIATGRELEAAFVARQRGQVVRVLFETEPEEGMLEGYSGAYVRVRAEGDSALLGAIRDVRITETEGALATGCII